MVLRSGTDRRGDAFV